MSAPQNIIAVVFDFDDTLTDDSTTALLESVGIDTGEFWKSKAKALLDQGWGPVPAYLKLLLDNVGEGKPFEKLTNARLREFGASLRFYPGIPGLFRDLQKSVKEHPLSNPGIEFYVVSSGLEEIIRGSDVPPILSSVSV
jgi:FMN phosphatase YigB (HAD superfamily)